MNYETLAKQLIRVLRGRRSQVALARRLRYSSNVLYTWESGRRWPTAAVFFELAGRVGIDVGRVIEHFLRNVPDDLVAQDFTRPDTVARFLSHLRGSATLVELAKQVGTNRVSVARWLKGESEPRLPDFLRLVQACSLRLLDFLSGFVSPTELAEARRDWEVLEAQRHAAYGLPWSHAVMRALELESYQRLGAPRSGWIAARLGISEEEEERCLKALSDSKLIRRRHGRWIVSQVLAVDTRHDPEAGRRLKLHWSEVAKERLSALEPNQNDLFSYNLFTVSERDWKRLRELHIAYYQELRQIIESSQPHERVALVNLQLMRLDEPIDGKPRNNP